MKTRARQDAVTVQTEPPARDLFRKLETLERELESTAHTGHTRWMVPYADLLTLLLGLFLVLFTASKNDLHKASVVNPTPKVSIQTEAMKQQQPEKDAAKPDAALAARLNKQLGGGLLKQGIEIRQQERGLVISLKDSILFAPGSAELSASARKTLDHLAKQLATALGGKSRPIRVEGHTDNTPITTAKYPSNWELSTARATNIVRYLIASHHFSPEKLSAAGYGEFKPVQNNSSIEGKQKNRRVDIVIMNDNTAQQEPPALRKTATPKTGARASGED